MSIVCKISIMNDFVFPTLKSSNIDTYIIRRSIFDALNTNLYLFQGKLLDVGCGKMPYKNHILENTKVKTYHGIDIDQALEYDENIKPDFYWDGNKLPFADDSYDCIIATEVLEHVPNTNLFLEEVYRVLKKEGTFFFTTPFFWNLHEVPHDQYRFTPFSLERHLETNSFKEIEITSSGTWHASMAQMLGLWVKRSPISIRKKRFLSPFVKLAIKILLKNDKPISEFSKPLMLTSLSGICRKS
jgi:SAM-dependent methyltransferase